MSYSSIKIVNSTNYPISGEISYMAVFCDDTDFTVEPHSTWQSEKCIFPIVEILAYVITPAGVFLAKPFISIGTIHNLFEITHTEDCNFRVVKMRNLKAKNHPQFLQPCL